MKTREHIKQVACELFNERGLATVTLRDVAQAMNRAYGNITYHFPNKEAIVLELYADMVLGLQGVSQQFDPKDNLLKSILLAPKQTFALSLKYLFLFKDYLEILRHYPTIAEAAQQSNELRKQGLKKVFYALQAQGLLRSELEDAHLDYLMELSGVMRTFFFVQLKTADYQSPTIESEYMAFVNRLLHPYLTAEGQAQYLEVLGKW
jgi:AcrR family transcriptional regulator